MTDETRPSCDDVEAQLAPYVDGEIPPDRRRTMDAHMTACPPCRRHAEAEADAATLLRARRESLKTSAPAGLRARCAAVPRAAVSPASQLSRVQRWLPLSVAASLLLAVAVIFAFALTNHDEALAAELTLDHMKCFQLSGNRAERISALTAADQWQKSQGWPLVVPPSAPAMHLRLLTVRRCLSTDGRVAHLMYLWNGEPLSVYVLPSPGSDTRVIDTLGHESVLWTANGRTYAVLAAGHPAGMDDVVGYVKANVR
jgi:anti-sigma factor (TIGR02949 family)